MDIVVRPAQARDAFALAALHIQAERGWGHPPGPGYLEAFADAWLADAARRTWLAESAQGRPLGTAHGTLIRKLPSPRRPADAWFHVSLLYVTPDARGHGLGHRLMEALLDGTAREGVTRVQLNAVPQARSLYATLGFGPPADGLLERRSPDTFPHFVCRDPRDTPIIGVSRGRWQTK